MSDLRSEFKPIEADIEKDRNVEKSCDSCGDQKTNWLYLVRNNVFGIFHICQKCKDELSSLELEEGTGLRDFIAKYVS